MAKTQKDVKTPPPAPASTQSEPPAPPQPKSPEVSSPASTPSGGSRSGLKALAQAHAAERPHVDNQAGTVKKAGRPPKSEEEKEAVRRAYEEKRKAQRARLVKPEKEVEPEKPKYSEAEKKSRIKVNAEMMATTTIGIFTGFFGDKFKDGATGNNDKEILESGWISYFTAKDIVDIPPILALILAHCSYLVPRISFKALWEKVFPEKEEKPAQQKPVMANAVKPREEDILVYKPPVGEPAESGAPGTQAAA